MTSVKRQAREPATMEHDDAIRSRKRSIVRVILVVLLALFIPPLGWFNLLTAGDYGFGAAQLGPNFVVSAVAPGSPEAQAGLRVGDRIDYRSLSLGQRLFITYPSLRLAHPGELVRFTVIRNGARVPIAVHFGKKPRAARNLLVILIKRISEDIFILIAGLLVLMRPSRMLWGLYLTSLGVTGYPFFLSWSPAWIQFIVYEILFQIYGTLFALGGMLLFVSRFPGDESVGWRAWIDRAAIPIGVFLAFVFLLSDVLQYVAAIPQPAFINVITANVYVAIPTLGTVCLLGSFSKVQEQRRQPLKWVVAAFVIYLAVVAYITMVGVFQLADYAWPAAWSNAGFTFDVLWGLQIIVPVTVAYAVLRHRLFDINFIISRAIVFTILSSFVVLIFTLIDWVFVRKLEQTGLGIIAGLIALMVLGFSAHALHSRVDTLVDRTFFKRRFAAEARLAEVAMQLPDASSVQVLDEILVREPLTAFRLTSAAVFRCGEDGYFTRENAIGWPPEFLLQLDGRAPPLSTLSSETQARRIQWRMPNIAEFFSGDAEPVLALPIVIRRKLQAVALYGPHDNGADFDAEEIRAINGLLIPARAAYDHLEAEELRAKAEDLRREGERARAEAERLVENQQVEQPDESTEPESRPS